MQMRKNLLILPFAAVLLFIATGNACGQEQQQQNNQQERSQELQKSLKRVRKATIMSAAFPGLGQIYNGKIWKAPIIYAGAATLIYFIDFNNDKYNHYKALYVNVDAPGPVHFYDLQQYQGYSDEQLKEAFKGYMQDFRRYRDLNIIGLAALYLANIVDAHVDAYFKNYDVSEKLSFDLSPTLLQSPDRRYYAGHSPGLSLTLTF